MSSAFDFRAKLQNVRPAAKAEAPAPEEAEALEAVAERHEFVSREPARRVKRERARPQAGPIEVLSVKGPLEVMNRFKAYCNAKGHTSYWQAIDALLKKAGE